MQSLSSSDLSKTPMLEASLPLEDAAALLQSVPSAVDLIHYSISPSTHPLAHVVLDALAPSEAAKRTYRLIPTERVEPRGSHVTVTDLCIDADTGIQFTQVMGPFDEAPFFFKGEQALWDAAFEDDEVRGDPQRHAHLLLSAPPGDQTALIATLGNQRATIVKPEEHSRVYFAPGLLLRLIDRRQSSMRGAGWQMQEQGQAIVALSTQDVRAHLESGRPLVWKRIYECTEHPYGFSRAWRDGTLIMTCLPSGPSANYHATAGLLFYRAVRAFLKDGLPAFLPIESCPPVSGNIRTSGRVLGTTTAGSRADEPMAACEVAGKDGIARLRLIPFSDLPPDFSQLIARFEEIDRTHDSTEEVPSRRAFNF